MATLRMKFTAWLMNLFQKSDSKPQEEIESDTSDPFDPFPEPVEIEIRDIIDLHTIPPRDVQAVVQEYLLQAYGKGFRSVRIIHGKGIGVQREMVRSLLGRTTFVRHWTDAPPGAGGLGATIVVFKESPQVK